MFDLIEKLFALANILEVRLRVGGVDHRDGGQWETTSMFLNDMIDTFNHMWDKNPTVAFHYNNQVMGIGYKAKHELDKVVMEEQERARNIQANAWMY